MHFNHPFCKMKIRTWFFSCRLRVLCKSSCTESTATWPFGCRWFWDSPSPSSCTSTITMSSTPPSPTSREQTDYWSSLEKYFLQPFLFEWFSHRSILYRLILWFISRWFVRLSLIPDAIILFWFPFIFLSRDSPTNAMFPWEIRGWGDAILYAPFPIEFSREHNWRIL